MRLAEAEVRSKPMKLEAGRGRRVEA